MIHYTTWLWALQLKWLTAPSAPWEHPPPPPPGPWNQVTTLQTPSDCENTVHALKNNAEEHQRAKSTSH